MDEASDLYYSIKEPSRGEYKEKGSKFFAYAAPVENEEQVKEILEEQRKEHPKSRHICYAFRIGTDGDLFRANDAGEPSGTAGKPVLGQIDSFGLTNVLVVVVRYFGGTQLGVPGLINAYKTAAAEALAAAVKTEHTIKDYFEIRCSYEEINDVITYIKRENIYIEEQEFEKNCKLVAGVRQTEKEAFVHFLDEHKNVSFKYLYTS